MHIVLYKNEQKLFGSNFELINRTGSVSPKKKKTYKPLLFDIKDPIQLGQAVIQLRTMCLINKNQLYLFNKEVVIVEIKNKKTLFNPDFTRFEIISVTSNPKLIEESVATYTNHQSKIINDRNEEIQKQIKDEQELFESLSPQDALNELKGDENLSLIKGESLNNLILIGIGKESYESTYNLKKIKSLNEDSNQVIVYEKINPNKIAYVRVDENENPFILMFE